MDQCYLKVGLVPPRCPKTSPRRPKTATDIKITSKINDFGLGNNRCGCSKMVSASPNNTVLLCNSSTVVQYYNTTVVRYYNTTVLLSFFLSFFTAICTTGYAHIRCLLHALPCHLEPICPAGKRSAAATSRLCTS